MAQGSPNYAIAPNNGSPAVLQIGDVSRISPISYQTIMTAGSNGTRVERFTFVSVGGGTVGSVARLFAYDGSAFHLFNEMQIPAFTPTSGTPDWSATLEAFDNPGQMPYLLKAGWTIRASINDSQIIQQANATSICAAQTTSGAAFLNFNGANVTAGSTAAIAAAANPGTGVAFTLTSSPYVLSSPSQIGITFGASTVPSVTIWGITPAGALVSETVVGVASSVVYSANIYKVLLQAVQDGSASNNMSIGYAPVADGAIFLAQSKVMIGSAANLSAINLSLVGSGANGLAQTETLAGPNNGFVTSANLYATLTSIATSGEVGSNIFVGLPAILGGVNVSAVGADF